MASDDFPWSGLKRKAQIRREFELLFLDEINVAEEEVDQKQV
jgi:hypothetical protein